MSRKIFRELLSIETAKEKLYSNFKPKPLSVETVPLISAFGRVLAEDVKALLDVPPFDRASMDGYAVKAEDTFSARETNPVKLEVVGKIKAGTRSNVIISNGKAVEIATGAPIPLGADAVVMVEYTISENDWVKIYKPVTPYENIMAAGSDIHAGETILRRGTLLTPREIGVLASFGTTEVPCYRKPKVAVLSTGDEIISPGTPLEYGKIYDINGYTLRCAASECMCEVTFSGIIKDNLDDIISKLKNALRYADLIIVSGGTSAGEGDLLYKAVDKLGKPGILVHGVSVKPGKPTIIGLVEGKPIFGLPGYPTSSLIIFDILVKPIIMEMAGLEPTENMPIISARLGEKVFSSEGRKEYIPVTLVGKSNGSCSAFPVSKGSGAITTLAKADGYIEIPENKLIIDKNEMVSVKLFSSKIKLADLIIAGENCAGIDALLDLFYEKYPAHVTKVIPMNTSGVLAALRREEVDVGVLIVPSINQEEYFKILGEYGLEKKITIIKGYLKNFGLIIRKEKYGKIQSFHDILNGNFKLIRSYGSSEREIFDSYLTKLTAEQNMKIEMLTQKISESKIEVKSNAAIVKALLDGEADVAFVSESIAVTSDFNFIPLIKQPCDFAVRNESLQRTPVQHLLNIIRSEQFKSKIACVRGLLADDVGEVLYAP